MLPVFEVKKETSVCISAVTGHIWSEIDAGTEVELSVPAAIAYATSQRQS